MPRGLAVAVGLVLILNGLVVLCVFVATRLQRGRFDAHVDDALDVFAEDLHDPASCDLCAIDQYDLACLFADVVFAHRAREMTGFYDVKPPATPGRDEP